jgi:hypothetical protein
MDRLASVGLQELGHVAEPRAEFDFDAKTRAACVRRSWEAALSVWFREGRDKARMALIIQLSDEQPLAQARLGSVGARVSHLWCLVLDRWQMTHNVQIPPSACRWDAAFPAEGDEVQEP